MGRGNGVVGRECRMPRGAVTTHTLDRRAVEGAGRVYTTGAVAKLCRVVPRTVAKWFDAGRLGGYLLPGSLDRRIPESDLVAFLKAHGMPIPASLGGGLKVAVLCPQPVPGADPVDPVECGSLAARGSLGAVVVGCGDGLVAACRLARHLRATDPEVRLAVVLGEDRGLQDVPDGVFDAVFGANEAGVIAWLARGR